MIVGERIALARKDAGMTQEELAKKMGYASKTAISKMEARDNIKLSTIENVAKAIGCSIDYLMGWEEKKTTTVPSFEPDHIKLISLYSKLSEEQKKTIMNLLESMV